MNSSAVDKSKLTISADPVRTPELKTFLSTYSNSLSLKEIENFSIESFQKQFEAWSNPFGFHQLPDHGFKFYLTSGVTQALDDFFAFHSKKEFRFFRGEYAHIPEQIEQMGDKLIYLDETSADLGLRANNAVIVSYPFAGNGEVHAQFNKLLEINKKLKIPIFIDCAYAGLSKDILNFDTTSVETIAFSFSKLWAFGPWRLGVSYSKRDFGSIANLNNWNYLPSAASCLALEIMNKFNFYSSYNYFKPKQIEFCKSAGLTSSSCYLFGMGNSPEWDEYKRYKLYNRVCISAYL
jgi:hypothetical protein